MHRLLILLLALSAPALARDSLGMFGGWGAFRDPQVPRCYAVAKAQPSARARAFQAYADVGTWPRRGVRGQVHFRLSRALAANASPQVAIAGQRLALTFNAATADGWASDPRGDAAIVAAMRSAPTMTVVARDAKGNLFSDTWQLAGAATAMDSATIACAAYR